MYKWYPKFKNRIYFGKIRAWKFIAVASVFLLFLSVSSVHAAKFGTHTETVVDMSIKILGGEFKVTRTWENGEWTFNKNLASSLQISRKAAVGSNASTPSEVYIKSQGIRYGSFDLSRSLPMSTRFRPGEELSFGRRPGNNKRLVWTGSAFRLVDSEGTWIEFYYSGGLGKSGVTKQGNRNNVEITLGYDASPPDDRRLYRITGIFDHNGMQILWYEYNDPTDIKNITAVRDYTGRRVEYTYVDGNLVLVKDVRGKVWSYTYADIRLESKTDPDLRKTQYRHSVRRALTGILDKDDLGTIFRYEFLKDTRQYYRQERSGGVVTESWLDSAGDFIRKDVAGVTVLTVTKDGRNRIVTDRGGEDTRYEYDEWENITKIIYPDNTSISKTYDLKFFNVTEEVNEKGVITRYVYDDYGNLTQKTEAVGLPEERVITYTYDLFGNRLTRTHESDNVTAAVTYKSSYDDFGNTRTRTDGELNVWEYTHDVMGNVLTRKNPFGKVWTYSYDNVGNFLEKKDPLGNITSYTYDGAGNRETVTDANLHTTTFVYDHRSRLVKKIDHLGYELVYDYDLGNKLIKITDQAGKYLSLSYDSEGRPTSYVDKTGNEIGFTYITATTEVGSGKLRSIVYPNFERVFEYDNRGRVTKQTDVLDASNQLITTFSYDAVGRIMSIMDPKSRVKHLEYDVYQRISRYIDALNKATDFAYDNRSNLISVTDPKRNTTAYRYDADNRVVGEKQPLLEELTYIYDIAGRFSTVVDAKGQKQEYLYDDADRNVTINSYLTSAAATPVKTTTVSYNNVGLINGYDDGTTSAVYTYDELNRKTLESLNFGPFTKTYGYSYTTNGLKQNFTAPDNVIYTYGYNDSNRLSSISIPTAGAITVNAFQSILPKKVTFPGGVIGEYSYDAFLRVVSINVKDPATNPVMNYTYQHDEVGNISDQLTEHGVYQFTYDDLDRLLTADNPNLLNETYSYDSVGNRLTDNNKPGVWGYNNNNQLGIIGAATSFIYDDNGSLTSKTDGGITTDYVYNLNNRLSEVKQGATTLATYYYDPFGRRLSKNIGGVVTYFMYADEGLIAEFNVTGTPIRQYGYQPDSTWGTDPTYLKTGEQYYYYQNDHLGTPKKLTAANGTLVWSAEYLAFGGVQVAGIPTVTNPLRFAGQYEDLETGFYYNFNRYYDPQVGRYISYDPIGLGGGINAYGYVDMAPTRMIDPEGLWGWPGAAAGAVMGGICAVLDPNADAVGVAEAVATGAVGGFFGGWGGVAAGAAASAGAAAAKNDCDNGAEAAAESVVSGATAEVAEQIARNSNRAEPGLIGRLFGCGAALVVSVTR